MGENNGSALLEEEQKTSTDESNFFFFYAKHFLLFTLYRDEMHYVDFWRVLYFHRLCQVVFRRNTVFLLIVIILKFHSEQQ